jgi:hypothetical protein
MRKIAPSQPQVYNQMRSVFLGILTIMVKLDMGGFDEFRKKLKKLEGKRDVPLSELMPDTFIRRNTKFQTLQAFLDAGGIEGQKDIGSQAFSKFIGTNSKFRNWDEMSQAAGTEWAKRQLGV